jgi:hypothetical protein
MTRSVSIALANCQHLAELWAGDRLFLDELCRRGWALFHGPVEPL